MIENIKLVTKNSLIYSLGNISVKLVGLILIPIYTNTEFLSFNDYGVLAILEASTQFFIAILGLALIQAFVRWYWDEDFKGRQKSIFFSLITLLLGYSLLLFAVFYPYTKHISLLLFDKPDFIYLLRLMFVSAILQMLAQFPLTLLKLQEKAAFYSGVIVLKLFVTLVVTIYMVVFAGRGLEGIMEAQIIGSMFFFLVLLPFMIKNSQLKFEIKIIIGMLAYSYPLVLGSISGILLSVFDKFTLNFMAELQDVGIYSLGFRISNTIKIIVISSIQLAITPMLFKMIGKEGNQRFYSKIMTYFSFVVLLAVLAMSLFANEIVKVFSNNSGYWTAALIIPVISLALFFGMLKDTALIALHIKKKTKVIGIVILFIALLNLALNILLIPRYTILGASAATLFSQIVFFVVIYNFAQKAYFIPYEIWKISKMVLLALILYFLVSFTNDFSLLLRLIIKSSILISFPFLLYFIGFYEENEIQAIKGMWEKWKYPAHWNNNFKDFLKKDS